MLLTRTQSHLHWYPGLYLAPVQDDQDSKATKTEVKTIDQPLARQVLKKLR